MLIGLVYQKIINFALEKRRLIGNFGGRYPDKSGPFHAKAWRTKEDDEKIIRLDYCRLEPFAGKLQSAA
jgi:hypothetical protein